jgi:hypothetical protein
MRRGWEGTRHRAASVAATTLTTTTVSAALAATLTSAFAAAFAAALAATVAIVQREKLALPRVVRMSDDETFGFIVTDSDGGYDEAKHTLIDDDAIDVVRTGNPSTPAAQPAAPMEAVTTGDLSMPAAQLAAPRDGRGGYDRSGGKGNRSAWVPHVQRHMESVLTGNLSSLLADPRSACSEDCPQGGKCVEAVGTVRLLKVCAAESFGTAALEQQWDKIVGNHACRVAEWFTLAHSGRAVSTDRRYPAGPTCESVCVTCCLL